MPVNFIDNPSELIKQVFNQIHRDEMSDLPFINPALSVNTIGFALYEEDWLGVLVTPWTLSLLLLPGPDHEWQTHQVGDKLGLKYGDADYTFMLNEHELLGQYLSCSLSSPVGHLATQAIAEQLAKDVRRLIVAIPVQNVENPPRRELFSNLLTPTPAL